MSNLNLYQIADAVAAALDAIDLETGELPADFDASLQALNAKGADVAAYILNQEAQVASLEAHKKEVDNKIRSAKNKNDRLKAYLVSCMKKADVLEIKHEKGLFAVRLQVGRDVSVEIDDGATFPSELCNPPPPPPKPSPSKIKIREAIEAGVVVEGARLVARDRLTIK